MDNKHVKLFATKQSKWCKFMPRMHQSTLGGLLIKRGRQRKGAYF